MVSTPTPARNRWNVFAQASVISVPICSETGDSGISVSAEVS